MGNTVDVIKGLIFRINKNEQVKNHKLTKQLLIQLGNKFDEVFVEDNDEVFLKNFEKLITFRFSNPYISNNFFPLNMNEYGKYNNIYSYSNDFRFEIRWIISCLLFQKDAINDFVENREKYDNLILLNKYEDAYEIIKYIEKEYGVSYWSMECKIFLNSRLGKDSKELLNESPHNIFGSILNFYELKNREGVTYNEYFYIVEREIKSARKNLDGCDDIIEFYNYYISSNVFKDDLQNVMQMLAIIQRCSLIDKYLFIIKICDELMNHSIKNCFYVSMQQYIQVLSGIKDDHLIALRFMFDEESNREKNYKLKNRLDNAKIEFISGNILKAREEAEELLKSFPNNTEAMSLLVECNILIGDGREQFKDTNLGMLLVKLLSVYTINEDRDDSIEKVTKLAISCSHSTWSQSLISNVMCRCCNSEDSEYIHHQILCNLQHLDIETVITGLYKDKTFKSFINMLDMRDNYMIFRKKLLDEEYQAAIDLCNVEQIKDYLFICNHENSISDKIMHLQQIKGKDASIAIRGIKVFLATIDIEKCFEIVAEIIANLLVDNIYTSLFIPWNKIISYIDEGPTEIRKNICTPILYYVYAYYIEKDKKDDLGIICNDFFQAEGINRPSVMKDLSYNYDKKLLVYFLKNVCTTKIMDDSIYEFTNTQERDRERVEICNVLAQLDIDNFKEYENEIRELTQKLMINAELKIIEENRIHVNLEGMRDSLEKSYKNDFIRFQFYQDERYQRLFLGFEGESKEKFRMIQYAPERILQELILHIRDAFVSSNEYGLNGYLSLNIRHGTLEDELRSPLNKAMLSVKKDINKNQYIIHEHWTYYANKADNQILQNAFANFYLKTESIINKLKGEYIQIRTESKNEEGIFDYRLDETDFLKISLLVEGVGTFEEFLDRIINYFWEITERNLDNIKRVIKDEITKKYTDAFSILKNDISELSNKNKLRDLEQKIKEAETDMLNVLDRICYWFQRSTESKHNDFDIQFAFNIGLQTIKNMHPEKCFIEDKLEETVSDKIPGLYLKSFDGIFYNLLDNIFKKAKSHDGKIRIGYSLKYEQGKTTIYVENDYDCTMDISDDISRVEKAKKLISTGEYLEKVKGEGGTGIPKICKIITYDLGHIPNLNFGYKIKENKFYMEIKF